MTTPPGEDEGSPLAPPPPGFRQAGLALLAVFTLRSAAAPLFEAMRPDLWLVPDRRLGATVTEFALAALAAAVVALARLERPGARPRGSQAAAAALVVAGAASILCAAARGPWTLAAARIVAGAASGVVVALLPTLVGPPERLPPRALGWLATGAPAGLAVGYLGASVFQRWPSWRTGFVAAGAFAIAAGALALLRGERSAPGAPPHLLAPVRRAGVAAISRRLLAGRERPLALLGGIAWALAVSALAAWLPSFLERSRGMPRPLASGGVGVLAVLVGFAGIWAGGRLVRALSAARAPETWAAACASGGAGALTLGMLAAWRPGLYLPALLGALFLLAASAGPLVGALRNALPAAERPALAPAALLATLALGDAPAPVLVGLLSDRLNSLGRAMFLVPVALLAAGALLAAAAALARPDQRPSASA